MEYHSTRSRVESKPFEDVLVSTYASDGGLYIPDHVPLISPPELMDMQSWSFPDICAQILHIYSGIEINELRYMARSSFALFNKDEEDPLPLTRLPNSTTFLLDTSLGPTFAFKDIGQQMVGKLLNHVLGKQNKKAKIVVETSGDTGPAAIYGVRGCSNVEIFCLYPQGRVSDVQELQMITIPDDNVHVYRTQGDSDEQASVLKELFRDVEFVKEHNICSVNSINWGNITFGDPINYVIPTGAFGNAMGAFLAKRMGLPIGRIICATNANDIVHRTLTTGDMSMGANIQTESPAMDIQFAYNLERMLYFICGEDPDIVRPYMQEVERQYSYIAGATGAQLDAAILSRIQQVFSSYSVSDAETLRTMKSVDTDFGIVLCPHSATSVFAALNPFRELSKVTPTICVLTAHPAKFEETVRRAIGRDPIFPEAITALRALPQTFQCLGKEGADWRREWINKLKADIMKY